MQHIALLITEISYPTYVSFAERSRAVVLDLETVNNHYLVVDIGDTRGFTWMAKENFKRIWKFCKDESYTQFKWVEHKGHNE